MNAWILEYLSLTGHRIEVEELEVQPFPSPPQVYVSLGHISSSSRGTVHPSWKELRIHKSRCAYTRIPLVHFWPCMQPRLYNAFQLFYMDSNRLVFRPVGVLPPI